MPRVVIVAFEGVVTLDATGPAEVFASVERRIGAPHYRVVLASAGGGPRRTSSGITVDTADLRALRPRPTDIVVIAGGDEPAIRAALADAGLGRWLARALPVVRRLTSVCSGAFLLASTGALDGKRATTHWSACDALARAFPRVEVDRNAIFIEQGRIWTSAGVTTGIDMALAIVEQDLGRAVADAVAASLVLYVRRPGFQSQFSDALVAQTSASDPLGPAIAWARANLGAADVGALARRAGLSVRTLHRRCRELLGTTPAKLLDKLRVEHARALMEAGPAGGGRRGRGERAGAGSGERAGAGSGERAGAGSGERAGGGSGERAGAGSGERAGGGRSERAGGGSGERAGAGNGERAGGGADRGYRRSRGGGGVRRAAAPAPSAGPLKTLAAHSGFGNAARMKRAFVRELGIAPRDYRMLHAPRRRHSR